MARETARQIDEAAADWAARLDRGLSPAEEHALDAWLAVDVRRVGAFGKARAISVHTERAQALGPQFATVFAGRRTEHPRSRRWLMAAGVGAVAAGLSGVGVLRLRTQGQSFDTRRGEIKVAPLADGSLITLNTASRLQVSFSPRARHVNLLQGEALFDVAKDPRRPFVVQAGAVRVRAVGTSFSVHRSDDGAVQVLVREGIVEVERGGPGGGRARMTLTANTRATVAAVAEQGLSRAPLAPDEVQQRLAWREGRIAFEGETLAEAAAEFSRYSDTRIVFADPSIGHEQITGLFQINDPVGFAQAAASALNLHAEVGASRVTLSR